MTDPDELKIKILYLIISCELPTSIFTDAPPPPHHRYVSACRLQESSHAHKSQHATKTLKYCTCVISRINQVVGTRYRRK